WRLPTRIEVESLLDVTRSSVPYINTSVFHGITSQTILWSSSTDVESPEAAWALSFEYGITTSGDKTWPAKVRCVRRTARLAAGTPTNRYVVNQGADTVTDTRTGLVWQRTVSTTTYTWEA